MCYDKVQHESVAETIPSDQLTTSMGEHVKILQIGGLSMDLDVPQHF
jgi:hypothetical protein